MTREKLLTRENVLKTIEKNGNKAEGLDLSSRNFVDNIDLSNLGLSGINLNNARLFRANFNGSNLDRAILGARLQHATFNPLGSKAASLQSTVLRNADLTNAEFKEADLTASYWGDVSGKGCAFLRGTDLRKANLFLADFTNCYFYDTKLEGAHLRGTNVSGSHLEEADWGNYFVGEETNGEFHFAANLYRQLKMWYSSAGLYEIAGRFFFREMEARRKSVQHTLKVNSKERKFRNFKNCFWLWFFKGSCGYGERPVRVIGWSLLVIVVLAVVYLFLSSMLEWGAFWKALYFSAVSFTALGYGSWIDGTWVDVTNNWIKGLGVFESFIGVFMMALFLVTFTRKMTR